MDSTYIENIFVHMSRFKKFFHYFGIYKSWGCNMTLKGPISSVEWKLLHNIGETQKKCLLNVFMITYDFIYILTCNLVIHIY